VKDAASLAQMALEEERHIRWISEAMALHRPLQV